MKYIEILVVAAIVLVVALLYFGFNPDEEAYHIFGNGKKSLKLESVESFFAPMSRIERDKIFHEHLERYKQLQEQVQKTWFAKYFVNYDDEIAQLEQRLNDVETNSETNDMVTFSTAAGEYIMASPGFGEDELLKFAQIVDVSFSDSNILITTRLERQDEHVNVNAIVSRSKLSDEENDGFQRFVDDLGSQVFLSNHVVLKVECSEEEDSTYEFRSRKK